MSSSGKRRGANEAPDPDDPETWTLEKLRTYCELNALDSTGLKSALVARVWENWEKGRAFLAEGMPNRSRTRATPIKRFVREEEDVSAQPGRKRSCQNSIQSAWTTVGSVLYKIHPDSHPGPKIAAFDLESTLVVPASGKIFPRGRNDWDWLSEEVPLKLQELHNDGYCILIISNQKNIGLSKVPADHITGKIDDMHEDCGVPLSAFLCTGQLQIITA